jgi:CxxC motif-containing protein (DUF1111 family)
LPEDRIMLRFNPGGHGRLDNGPARLIVGCLMAIVCPMAVAGGGSRTKALPKDHYEGRQLFIKVWEPGKRGSGGGDGLGPLYNDTSCVGCHRLGGVGGGGGNQENVRILTADGGGGQSPDSGKFYLGELEDLVFGFRNATSTVLHRHATTRSGEDRLKEIATYKSVVTHDRRCFLRTSERNTPAIFGAGLIDAMPEEVLLESQQRKLDEFPEIHGRVSRLPDGRLGRFGWKGQTATLREFVMAACANELGLEVPDHHQPRLQAPGPSDPAGVALDLDQSQCDQLVAFVAALAPPRLRPIVADRVEPWGYSVFKQVGCAACHTPRLGAVNGLYSDLLLHEMGNGLGDIATSYGETTPSDSTGDLAEDVEQARVARAPARKTEWRTPPLWGVADSAPYLHDGRARTIHEAIQLHGGEAEATVGRYAKLSRGERMALFNFLNSLTAAAKGRKAAAIDAIQARSRAEAASGPDDPRE